MPRLRTALPGRRTCARFPGHTLTVTARPIYRECVDRDHQPSVPQDPPPVPQRSAGVSGDRRWNCGPLCWRSPLWSPLTDTPGLPLGQPATGAFAVRKGTGHPAGGVALARWWGDRRRGRGRRGSCFWRLATRAGADEPGRRHGPGRLGAAVFLATVLPSAPAQTPARGHPPIRAVSRPCRSPSYRGDRPRSHRLTGGPVTSRCVNAVGTSTQASSTISTTPMAARWRPPDSS